MKIFVAGATGKTGRQIVRQLITQGSSVEALVKDLPILLRIYTREIH